VVDQGGQCARARPQDYPRRGGTGETRGSATVGCQAAGAAGLRRRCAIPGQVGQRSAELSAGADVELGEDLVQVPLDGARAEEQLGGDLWVGLDRRGPVGQSVLPARSVQLAAGSSSPESMKNASSSLTWLCGTGPLPTGIEVSMTLITPLVEAALSLTV
jgi:hypothetical protein